VSDTQVETPEAVADGPVDYDSTPEAPAESVERRYVPDYEDDYYVKLKVQGEDTELPWSEARDGWMRQADYTRKTQEVAAERERLTRAEAVWTALEQDPSGTLQALQEAFGLDTSLEQGADEPVDEYEARLRRVEQAEQERQEQAQIQAVEREIGDLQSRYGDFDQDSLIAYAIEKRIPDLEAAFLHRRERENVAKEQEAEKQRKREAAMQAKREASVVEGGAHRSGAQNQLPSKPTLRQAFLAAKEALG
jgi:hypothetical protein